MVQALSQTQQELQEIQANLEQGRVLPPTNGGLLRRIIPTLLAHHALMQKVEQSQKLPNAPLEARILLVADVYDSLTSAQTERISPSDAMQRITQRAGIEYDAEVVDAMVKVFRKRAAGAGEGAR